MTNNDILRRLRYSLNFNDAKMRTLFALAGYEVSNEEISDLLRREEEEGFLELTDKMLAVFLNGLIVGLRGKTDAPMPEPEEELNNNLILRKLKIALNLKSEDILKIYETAEKPISPHELSSFFRKPGQKQYRECNDQYLRHFLTGLQKLR